MRPCDMHARGRRALCAQVEAERALAEKLHRLELWEAVEEKEGVWTQMGESMVHSLVESLLRMLTVRVSDVHVRIGDADISAGVTLSSLTVTNLSPRPTQKKAPAPQMRKMVELLGFACYLDGGADDEELPATSRSSEGSRGGETPKRMFSTESE